MRPLPAFTVDAPAQWLLSFDFDGTLVWPDLVPHIDSRFFALIQQLRQSHRTFWGINTGRSLMQTVQGLSEANFPFLPDYIIAREREIYTPNEFGRWVDHDVWNKPCQKAHHKLFRKSRRHLKKMRQWVETNTEAVWGQQEGEPDGVVATTVEEMDAITSMVNAERPSGSVLSYQRNGIYMRFSHADYNKGTAMREVAHQLGLGPDNIFAIGDSHNDLDMLDPDLATHLACPANACPEVKQHLTQHNGYIAHDIASQGTIEALSALFHS